MYSQETSLNFWDHVRFGGGLGLSFGEGFFSGTLAPSGIYEFNDPFAVGFGLNGTYNRLKNTYTATILGGSVLSLFTILPELQLSSEFEVLHVARKYDTAFAIDTENYWYPALFFGAGYRNQNVTFGIRYDVLYDSEKSIYAHAWMPFVRVYF
ncbi:MAG: alpha-ketoglutarate decarboxylase [Flavobacteriaceae bacterium]